MRLDLSVEDMYFEFDPCAGGAVSALRHRDLDVLRTAPDRMGPAFDPLKYAAFTMVPFVGRIHHGQFGFDQSMYELPANFPPEPHAIHGHGWQVPWKVEAQDATSVTCVYQHSADAWPWNYVARQVFSLLPNGLIVTLAVTNTSEHAMPAGVGWHPYFTRDGARLHLPTTHIWTPDPESGDNQSRPIASYEDLSNGRMVADLNLDTTFSVGAEPIRVEWPTHSVTMTTERIFSHATVYVPPGENYFCVEPVSHVPNAVNSTLPAEVTGFRSVGPGETLSGSIKLIVEH